MSFYHGQYLVLHGEVIILTHEIGGRGGVEARRTSSDIFPGGAGAGARVLECWAVKITFYLSEKC